MILWVFIDFFGMTLATIAQGPNPQAMLFFNTFGHFVVLSIGLFSFYRRQLKWNLAFKIGLFPLLTMDLICLAQELSQAYTYAFVPCNYFFISGIDLYLLYSSFSFTLALKGYHDAAKHAPVSPISSEPNSPEKDRKITDSQNRSPEP